MPEPGTVIDVGDQIWDALNEHGWVSGEQRLTTTATSITSCASPYTRGSHTLVLVCTSPYTLSLATLNDQPLADGDAVWQAVTAPKQQ